jgi:hypothetical protein
MNFNEENWQLSSIGSGEVCIELYKYREDSLNQLLWLTTSGVDSAWQFP